ncbi:MAG: hypothetical protein HYY85_01885 [Deltaproteobacteria bacterium]|nr:hypothetical protein [Deltaproteobacteria bacterium]
MAFEQELEFFERNKENWLRTYPQKYAVIKGEAAIGFFDTLEEAYREGLNKFWPEAFLIKQVLEQEPVIMFPLLSMVPPRGGL